MPTSYQLFLHVSRKISLRIGRLGRYSFDEGVYVYTGSAKKNIKERIARHKRKKKSLRWHIDYLLSHPAVGILDVRTFNREECILNQATRGSIPIKGFGSSDCKAGCKSHLKYIVRVQVSDC